MQPRVPAVAWAVFALLSSVSVGARTPDPKPPLDADALLNWQVVDDDPAISSNGQYVVYTIRNQPRSSQTLIVQATKNPWKQEFVGATSARFTADGQKLVVHDPKAGLCVVTLGAAASECTPDVASFELKALAGVERLFYQTGGADHRLVIRNLQTDKEQSFSDVSRYATSKDGQTLVLLTESGPEGLRNQSLLWVDPIDGERRTIWHGRGANNLVINDVGDSLAFLVEGKVGDQSTRSVWLYRAAAAEATPLRGYGSEHTPASLTITRIERFSSDGRRLFVGASEIQPKPNPDAIKVNVWSYTDGELQPTQLAEAKDASLNGFAAVVELESDRITRLQEDGERITFGGEGSDGFALIEGRRSRWYELNSSTSYDSYYLVSTETGKRTRLPEVVGWPQLSPAGRYLVGSDSGWTDWYSYDVASGVTRNISEALSVPPADDNGYGSAQEKTWRGLIIAGWLVSDSAVLLYDRYDIWQVDPAGIKPPINLTHGYGRHNDITFRLAEIYRNRPIENLDLLLTAFDNGTKAAGFYRISAQQLDRDPERLTMGRYLYGSFDGKDIPTVRFGEAKARDAQVYLVGRESATESPNLFWTKDFRTFVPISDVHPERNYRWPKSELLSFETLDGRAEQAVLYRPQDFDSNNKYPAILFYYEKKSDQVNYFPEVPGNGGELSIPWFVSHGYVVVVPDIIYPPRRELGHNGESAYEAIIGIANYLKQFPWVDGQHMGLQGHSFGGFETLYVTTHTDRFAAAVASCGISDEVSSYGELWGSGEPRHGYYENRQGRMGATLWERPERYIENSPILEASRVSTPILTVANRPDQNVDFAQGLAWFTAMRRLGKRAWMLEYDDGGHGLQGKDYVDYTNRMQQFFDHYLKGSPAPKWMTQGIPARLKGIDNGMELDTTGAEPKELPANPSPVGIP